MLTKIKNQVVEYDCPGSEFSLQSWAFFSINKCLSLSFKFFSCVKLSFICVIIIYLYIAAVDTRNAFSQGMRGIGEESHCPKLSRKMHELEFKIQLLNKLVKILLN